jgi:hypothetical protein
MRWAWTQRFFWMCCWIAILGFPIGILVLGSTMTSRFGTSIETLYLEVANVLGDWPARIVFGGSWLAFGVLLFWRTVLSKHRHEDSGPPADLHD